MNATRFSLRELLIGLGLVCAVLGAMVFFSRARSTSLLQARLQSVKRQIHEMGGAFVERDDQMRTLKSIDLRDCPEAERWWDKWKNDTVLRDIDEVRLPSSGAEWHGPKLDRERAK